MASWLATLLVIVVALVLLLWRTQRRLIYFPFGEAGPVAATGLPRGEDVTFATDDGLTLEGWFVPAARSAEAITVIVFNGNGGNRSLRVPLALALSTAGVSVLLFDYRGYGGNPGRPSESGLAADARAARAYLDGRPDVDTRRVAYFGESLGAGVAVALALERPPAALILRSPFTSLADVGQYHYPFLPVRRLLWDRYAALDGIGRLRGPILVIAGDRDTIVPPEFTRRLYEAAPPPKRLVIINGADHNDFDLLAGEQMVGEIVRLLEALRNP